MGTFGNDGHVAVGIAPVVVVGADRQQTGVFATGPAVGLQATGGKAGDLGQVALQFREELLVALGLLDGRKGVDVGELRPADGHQLGGGVQFHGAGAERDHAVHQAEVLVFQPLQVAHHFRFGAVLVEVRVGQEVTLPTERRCNVIFDAGDAPVRRQFGAGVVEVRREDPAHRLEIAGGHRLVEADPDAPLPGVVEVVAFPFGAVPDLDRLLGRYLDVEGIEKLVAGQGVAGLHQRIVQDDGEVVGTPGDGGQPLRSVVGGVEAGHVGQQGLGRTDVGSGLLPADVLLPRLQGHPQGVVAVAVLADADDAAGDLPLVLVQGSEVGGVGPTEAHRDAEALGIADHGVRPPLSGRGQQGQGEQVGADDGVHVRLPGGIHEGPVILDATVRPGILQHHGKDAAAAEIKSVCTCDLDPDVQRLRPRPEHGQRLRQYLVGDQQYVGRLVLCPLVPYPVEEPHGLGRGRPLVEQTGVGDRHAGQVADHRLEVEQPLQPPLGDLRLVGGVLGVPARVLKNVAGDDARGNGAVVAHAHETAEDLVAAGDALQVLQVVVLADGRGDVEVLAVPDVVGHRLVHQLVQGIDADGGEHFGRFGGRGADVAVAELVETRGQGGHAGKVTI